MLAGIVAIGSGPGQPPVVRIYDAATGTALTQFAAFPPSYRGGVQVAVGDVNGDGTADIVVGGSPGGVPIVEVFDGTSGAILSTFRAASPAYRGSFSIASGDVTGTGRADVVVSYGQGEPWVSVYDGLSGTPLASFLAYGANTRGGVRIAVGNLSNGSQADIATVNAAGVPEVKEFSGATFSTLSDFKASYYAPAGGASIAAGNISGGGTTDLVIAQASPRGSAPGAEVAVFPGTSSTPLASFTIAGRGYTEAARVAAVDVAGTGNDDIALAPASGGSAVVLDSFGIGNTLDGTPGVLYTVPFAPGGSLAATSSVSESTSSPGFGAPPPTTATPLTPIQRLGYYDKSTGQFVSIKANDPRLVGKDVYVIVHGWAPGYDQWVAAAAAKGQTLLWWNTFPTQLGYDPTISGGLPPDSNFLLDGNTVGGVVVNPTGLAQTLAFLDPNAAVLAYSWIDESATPNDLLDASPAEAKTALNGERLAEALSQALGTTFTGKLQLIGHSFGSKVATVAAAALTQDKAADVDVNQLTILDSPEDPGSSFGEGLAYDGAVNYNWYFLQNVNVDKADSNGTFVDNYISYLDEPYSNIAYTPSNLGNVVDVKLNPLVYSADDPGDKHSYAAQWYAGSAWPTITYGNRVGRYWSPLVPDNLGLTNPPADLQSSYGQTWTSAQQSTQFNLAQTPAPPSNPVFNPITFPTSAGPGATLTNPGSGSNASITLTQQGGKSVSYAGTFTTVNSFFGTHGIRGVTFAYDFTNYAPGDELTITIDSYIGSTYVGFVMDPAILLSPSGLGTISVGDPNGDVKHTLTFTLTSAPGNDTSSVTVSKLQQLSY